MIDNDIRQISTRWEWESKGNRINKRGKVKGYGLIFFWRERKGNLWIFLQ